MARLPVRSVAKSFVVRTVLGTSMVVLTVSACTSSDRADSPPPAEPATRTSEDRPTEGLVALPDLSAMNEAVQAQINQRYTAVLALSEDAAVTSRALADGHGDLGMVLLAADLREVAEHSFLNAESLEPTDMRWPYFLGHLYRDAGDTTKALAAFERAESLQPDYTATLVYLADMHLELGAAQLAEPLFTKALSLAPDSLSARYGLGRTALMNEEYDRAVSYLEEILDRNPDAAAAHYPLGLAYRSLGELERAEEHILRRENEEILPADPLMVALDALLESPQVYERRGIESLNRGDWDEAESLFREGLELDPTNAALRHRLGTALFMRGDERGALSLFEAVVRSSPEYPPAQLSLGVVYQNNGRHEEAIQRFETALEYRSTYTEARLMLATSLRRTGRAAAALIHFDELLATEPDVVEARFGRAMAYVQLHRYQEARDHLLREMELYPEVQSFPHALARVLAAAPDDRVRDGGQALALIETLIQGQRNLDLGETMAMVLAELGRFEEAISIQQELIEIAQNSQLTNRLPFLMNNLTLFQTGQPSRSPWQEGAVP